MEYTPEVAMFMGKMIGGIQGISATRTPKRYVTRGSCIEWTHISPPLRRPYPFLGRVQQCVCVCQNWAPKVDGRYLKWRTMCNCVGKPIINLLCEKNPTHISVKVKSLIKALGLPWFTIDQSPNPWPWTCDLLPGLRELPETSVTLKVPVINT